MDAIVVARGGGSLADLLAFCDETLCRTVALLRVPVIASVGHHTDRTLLDDVAAVSCSTPTHAAEAAVPLHCGQALEALAADAGRLSLHARRAVLSRARALSSLARAPAQHVATQLAGLHQSVRELRASARRAVGDRLALTARRLLVFSRKADVAELARVRAEQALAASAGRLERSSGTAGATRRRELERLRLALDAHHPERTLARGYALVEDRTGRPVTSVAAARRAGDVGVRFADGVVPARIQEDRDP
jgi:exodeoxyribonuclease VII large subunit